MQRRFDDALEKARGRQATRRAELGKLVKQQKQMMLRLDIERLEAEIQVAGQQQELLDGYMKEFKLDAKKVAGTSVDLEIRRREIATLETLVRSIAEERQKLEIEIAAQPRVTVRDEADPNMGPDRDKKLQMTLGAGLAGFFLPFALIIWLDARTRRINSPEEVPQGTGLDVIGALPLAPGSVPQALVRASARQQRWRAQLNESVDGVAARLLHKAEHDHTQVVLVSSAVSGEGKTVLATQLSLSLARTGHKTLLIDFDLRRPSVGNVFALTAEPGVAEVLRKEVSLEDAVQDLGIDHLTVLTAGQADRQTFRMLANGDVKALFDTLRQEYEFVIVDGSPILPVVDARLLCRHVDAVVFSIFRDISRTPSVQAACDVLAGFGIRPLGAVVTGAATEQYYYPQAD
jgi:capsular exopolysaccharide synthesis family protein